MGEVLSFVGGLLTVYVVEGARVCNGGNVVIAYPTGPLLVFNLVGGAFVWEVVVVPAFLHRVGGVLRAREGRAGEGTMGGDDEMEVSPLDPDLGQDMRHLGNEAEAVAIPVAVLLGFILPSVLMLALGTPLAVGIWLFSPIYVSLIRKAVRALLPRLKSRPDNPDDPHPRSLHLESHRPSLALVYAAPVLFSVLSHVLLIWHLAMEKDDRRDVTRATLGFIVINVVFTALTVLYWLFVEVGWRVVGVMVCVAVVLGPGAGVCAGWVYREGRWHEAFVRRCGGGGDGDRGDGGSRSRSSSRSGSGSNTAVGSGGDERAPLLG